MRFGLQFYIVLGTNRAGFHFVPFDWHMGWSYEPHSPVSGQSVVAMLGPLMFTVEEDVT